MCERQSNNNNLQIIKPKKKQKTKLIEQGVNSHYICCRFITYFVWMSMHINYINFVVRVCHHDRERDAAFASNIFDSINIIDVVDFYAFPSHSV